MSWPDEFFALLRGDGCPMCADDGPEDTGFGLRFLVGRVSNSYLQRVNVQSGYAVVVWTRPHVAEPDELSPHDATRYWSDVMNTGRLLREHFNAIKINYLTLGNELPHLHTHVIPRYADTDPNPGGPFPLDRHIGAGRIPEDEFRTLVDALRARASEHFAKPS